MRNIKLLDCTLRDGGYINDWDFGYVTIRNIVRKLVESQADYIEVGFLRDCQHDKNKVLFNNCSEIEAILPEKRGNALFTAMALHNKYDIMKLEPYDGKTVDAIRVTFHDYDIEEGLVYIQKVMDKGYKVFINPINIMGYTDYMILQLLEKVNEIHPYAFSIVDTFGSMMKEDLLRIYSLVEHNLDKKIVIGLHLHENLALSYSLAQDFINMKASDRECVIDASMLGMGRSPGNLCMELIMDYMNKKQSGHYDINPVLDGIDDHIVQLKQIEAWGYHTAYALSAKYNLHRNYAEFLLDKGRLRAKQINQILGSIENGKKTAYDEAYIEKLYQDFQNNEVDDTKAIKDLGKELRQKECLILAPGSSILSEQEKIKQYIKERNPVIFSTNFIPDDYIPDFVFCCNAMRYEAILSKGKFDKCILTSNLLDMCQGQETFVNYADLSFNEKEHIDNSVIMLIKLLKKLEVAKVVLAGFDGYKTGNEADYVDAYMRSQHTKGNEENRKIKECMRQFEGQIDIQYLTKSIYQEE